MNENVISISSRKPLTQQMAEDAERAREEGRNQAERDEAFTALQLELLDQVRAQIAAGKLSNLLIVARAPDTGLFMQDLILHPDLARSSAIFGFVGVLECLKLELTEVASMAPTLLANGEVIDAHEEVSSDEYPEGEEW